VILNEYCEYSQISQKCYSEILVKHSNGSTIPYSGPNLATMLSGVTVPVFVLERVDVKGNNIYSLFKLEIRVYHSKLWNCVESLAIKSRPAFR
jgi:hypothetical protein